MKLQMEDVIVEITFNKNVDEFYLKLPNGELHQIILQKVKGMGKDVYQYHELFIQVNNLLFDLAKKERDVTKRKQLGSYFKTVEFFTIKENSWLYEKIIEREEFQSYFLFVSVNHDKYKGKIIVFVIHNYYMKYDKVRVLNIYHLYLFVTMNDNDHFIGFDNKYTKSDLSEEIRTENGKIAIESFIYLYEYADTVFNVREQQEP